MTMPRRELFLAPITLVALLALTGCGSGGTQPTVGPTTPPATTVPFATPEPGDVAAQLCTAFDETLAAAALGEAVDAPTSGDVVPRPNGVYCRYSATADSNHNVEVQLKGMTRDEFEALAETLQMEDEISGVGEAAYMLERSLMGGSGAAVLAFAGSRGVTVVINADGDQAAMQTAAMNIAKAVLAYA